MDRLEINGKSLRLVKGDITTFKGDAIVNAANSALAGGGGVDGAIHRAGGPSIDEECSRIGGCPTGEARITGAGRLPVRYVIHAVGPVWHGGNRGEPELLVSAYHHSLRLAEEYGVESIAFPSISAGVYGYPVDQAARIAITVCAQHLAGQGSVRSITLVQFSDSNMAVYEAALGEIAASFSDNSRTSTGQNG